MLYYNELLDAMKSSRISGRRSSGHYDHDDIYNIGPFPLRQCDLENSPRENSSVIPTSEDLSSPKFEAFIDNRTGERLYRPIEK
ncbi:MAG: hypothetical protein WCU00_02560, partial [Candidatus Latescibacterota bacterium]